MCETKPVELTVVLRYLINNFEEPHSSHPIFNSIWNPTSFTPKDSDLVSSRINPYKTNISTI